MIETETHATRFSWSKWLAAWIAGACAQPLDNDIGHGGHPANTKPRSLGLQHISLILDIHVTSIDTCQNKVSSDQYHVTISRAQV